MWGALASSTLVLGAILVRLAQPSTRAIAVIMALGSGVLLASVAYDLVEDALDDTSLVVTAAALLGGAVTFVLGSRALERGRSRRRKSPEHGGSSEGNALAIALGTALDGVPESVVLGLTAAGGSVSAPLLAGGARSNLPEGMASTSGLLSSGWSMRRVLRLWGTVVAASAVGAAVGASVLEGSSPAVAGAVQLFAGGALLAMVADTMLPEAYVTERDWTGPLLVFGFLLTLGLQSLA